MRSAKIGVERIRTAAKNVVSTPLQSRRIEIAIWFYGSSKKRADVDNVAKLILDALKNIVYRDDGQVRSVSVTAVPDDDDYGMHCFKQTIDRLINQPNTFLINVYDDVNIGNYLA
jgi:hypothetical protein